MTQAKATASTKSNFGKWGWSMIFYSFICYYITSGLCTDGLNLYTEVFPALHGWSATQVLMAFSVANWISVIGTVFWSRIGAKKGSRFTSVIGSFVCGIIVIIFGTTTSFTLFFIAAVCMCFVAANVYLIVVPHTLMNKWFPKKKGIALGWATMGMPFCSMTFLPLLQFGFNKIGISGTFVVVGAAIIVFGVVSIWWCKDYPELVGAYPDNEKISEEQLRLNAEREKKHVTKWTTKALLKDKNAWCIGLGYGLVWLAIVGIVSQLIPRMISAGFEPNAAIMFFSVVAGIGMIGSYIWGWLDQKIGTKKTSLIYGVYWILALVLLISDNHNVLYAACVIVGLGIGGIGNLVPSMQGTIYGRYDFIEANKVIAPITTVVRTMALTIIGIALGLGYGYAGAYIVMIVCVVIGTIIMAQIQIPQHADQEA